MRIKFLLKNYIPEIGHFWHYRKNEFTHTNVGQDSFNEKVAEASA